ncbi:MAG: class II aldolase/adducin family protein [Bacillota bacterium]
MLESMRREVLSVARQMARDGLAPASWGNVSARDPESGLIAITPSGLDYWLMEPGDICLLRPDGQQVEGERRPSTEVPMHLAFYRERPDVGGIVHTHSTYATCFAALNRPIPAVVATVPSVAGDEIPVCPYLPAGTEELGRAAIQAMGEWRAVLLANHGVVAVGNNVFAAYNTAQVVEHAAKVYHACLAVGEPHLLSGEQCRRAREHFVRNYGQRS